jgi:23S rRNA pseudouridine1911/1915/1917 synthase
MKYRLEVLYEDNHIIAVNKDTGELVQGDKTGDKTLADEVKEYIKRKYKKPGDVFLGIVHRIDRPTSGVVLFARTSKALTRLNQMFADKEIKKTYWAIVDARPPTESGRLVHWMKKNEEKNKSNVFDKCKGSAKEAIMNYKLIVSFTNYHLLEVDLETGRHHQIRGQLARIGCHIKGDLKYGAKRSNPDGGISLHSRAISFIHPVKKEPITITATPPEDNLWNEFMQSL